MSYLRIFEAFIEFGETHVLCKFLEQDFDKDTTAKIDKRKTKMQSLAMVTDSIQKQKYWQ